MSQLKENIAGFKNFFNEKPKLTEIHNLKILKTSAHNIKVKKKLEKKTVRLNHIPKVSFHCSPNNILFSFLIFFLHFYLFDISWL